MVTSARQGTLFPALDLAESPVAEADELRPKSKSFLHYCSLSAFYSIIDSSRLRFTSAKSTNDPSEFVFGSEVVNSALAKIVMKHGNGPANCLAGCVENFSNRAFQAFVFCMTEATKAESFVGELSQWRLYGSDGRGVGLVFDTSDKVELELLSELAAPPRRVTYGSADGERMVEGQIEKFFAKLAAFSPEELKMVSAQDAQEGLLRAVFWLPSTIKHQAYRHEREVRLIRGDIGEDKGNPLVFFERGSIQRPAIEREVSILEGQFPDLKHRSPIKRVIIGPSGDQAAIHDSIRYYLSARGWDLDITRSDIPYRAVS